MFEDELTGEGREQTGTGAAGSGPCAAGGGLSLPGSARESAGRDANSMGAPFDVPVDDLDASGVLEALCGTQQELVDRDCRLLELAGQWIDVHGPDDPDDSADPATGDGTPVGRGGGTRRGGGRCRGWRGSSGSARRARR